ncbi:MAG: tetratricopeptide repeat protein, partial [Casimicrobiaceae bacterium]
FCRIVPPDELAVLADRFSDGIAASIQLAQLIRNCIALAQWAPAAALAKRRLAVLPADGEARAQLERAERGLTQGPAVGRNDPCPCGSGKRYKLCHGALSTAGVAVSDFAPPTSHTRAAADTLVSGGASPALMRQTSADTLAQQGLDAHRRGDVVGAERAYREALARDTDQPLALHYLGVALYQQGHADDALPLLERAVARVPQEAEFHNNLGLALAALDRNADAAAAHRTAIALRPGHATAWNNLGLVLMAMSRIAEAIDAYRQALAAQSSFAHAHWNLALALLARGEYAEGWREYEWRLRLPELGGNAPKPLAPRWTGDDLNGRTLLVTTEQGLGDAVQFVRYAKALAERGARVVVEAGAPLARLLATAPGVARTQVAASVALGSELAAASTGTGTTVAQAFDYSIPLLSIPGVLAVGPTGLASDTPYLRVEPDRRAEAVRAIA